MTDLQNATVAAIVNVFETGRVLGDYSAVAVLKGDSGHLSYGRSQTTLGSGNLFKLLDLYCKQQSALYANDLKPYLPRFQQRDVSLDYDKTVRNLLHDAGQKDAVMRATQDQFFNTLYFAPATRAAEDCGIRLPLGVAIVYDSHIQGGWDKVRSKVGGSPAADQQKWLTQYVGARKEWLLHLNPPLPTTSYRMDAFHALIDTDSWELPLPLKVHGVTISEATFGSGDPVLPGGSRRKLQLITPYLRGDDVEALQQALKAKGLDNPTDRVYGPFTDTLVKKWQQQNGIQEEGAGPETLKSLGL